MQIYHDLMSGNGVHPDPNLAMKWLFEALKHDFPPAYRERARRALTDDQNFDLYQINLSIAAELNDPEAQVEYGQLFLTGNGVQKWPYYALVWFLRAQINDQDVDQLIQAAEQEIDATDRKLARKNAANFDFKRSR
jgi:ABC-type transport system substrate-binding protein